MFAAIYAVHAALCLFSFAQIRRFLRDTRVVANERALRRYKEFVRIQMYLALFAICLLVAGAATSVLLIVRHGRIGVAAALAANACVFAAGKRLKTWEVRSRTLEVTSEPLRQEYARVSESWLKKPLPDF